MEPLVTVKVPPSLSVPPTLATELVSGRCRTCITVVPPDVRVSALFMVSVPRPLPGARVPPEIDADRAGNNARAGESRPLATVTAPEPVPLPVVLLICNAVIDGGARAVGVRAGEERAAAGLG